MFKKPAHRIAPPTDLLSVLSGSSFYELVISRLQNDLRKALFLRGFDERNGKVSLRWILGNSEIYIREVTRAIKARSYYPMASRKALLTLSHDKPREIFIQDWTDRIVQSALAEILGQHLEPHLPDSVYSFRKGRSNHQAVRGFAEFSKSHFVSETPIYILRRDIRNFALTIPVELMISKWQELLGQQDDYILRLMRCMMTPEFVDAQSGVTGQLTTGVVPGSPILPVCANFLLMDVDRKVSESFPGFYARYGDDIVYADPRPDNASAVSTLLTQLTGELQLAFNEKKSLNCCFSREKESAPTPHFPQKPALDYLGVSIRDDGSVFLPVRKLESFKRSLRSIARRAYLANKPCGDDYLTTITSIIQAVNLSLSISPDLPYFSILLMPEIDRDALKRLDCWIAKQCLAPVFGTGHDRVFRSFPYKKLKDLGLRSLHTALHRRIRSNAAPR